MPGREQVRGFFGVRMRAAGWIENHRVNRLLTSSCSTFRAFGPTPDALDRAPLNNGVISQGSGSFLVVGCTGLGGKFGVQVSTIVHGQGHQTPHPIW